MKKKLHFIILVGVIVYGAIFIAIMLYTIFTPSTVYDNQELIAKNQSSANKMNYKLSRHDGTTTITCGKMQGMDIIWEYEADEDAVCQMYYNLKVTSGKAKLVLIQPDKTVITLAEQDSTANENSQTAESITTDNTDETTSTEGPMVELDLKKGKNRIKIVCGKGTSFSLSFTIP